MDNLIFGLRPVFEAVKAGKDIDKVLVKNNLTGDVAGHLLQEIRRRGIPLQYVPNEKLNRLCTKNHQGVVAYIAPIAYQNLEAVLNNVRAAGRPPLLVMLDGITDVRNFGAIARTCECAGVDAIIIPTQNSVRINDDAIKTSAGALYNIAVCRETDLVDCVLLLQQSDINVVAITEKAPCDIYSTNLCAPTTLVFGAEDNGISNRLLKRIHTKAKLPMTGKTESLNVSVAAAVAVYETMRQRKYH